MSPLRVALGVTGAILVVLAGGCENGSQDSAPARPSASTPRASVNTGRAEALGPAAVAHTAKRVLDGAQRDFRAAADEPPEFAACFLPRFERELTATTLGRLVGTYRANGEAPAARALNRLAAPVGDACGQRQNVPELSEAAKGLAAGAVPASATKRRPPAAKVTATCERAIIGDVRRPPPSRAAIAWGFAIYDGGSLRDAIPTRREEFKMKMGVVVKGAERYVLSVPTAKLGKVSLNYTFRSFRRIARGATRVTFEPCPNRVRTAWAGGLVVKQRRPITLKVKRASGEVKRIRVGRIKR